MGYCKKFCGKRGGRAKRTMKQKMKVNVIDCLGDIKSAKRRVVEV